MLNIKLSKDHSNSVSDSFGDYTKSLDTCETSLKRIFLFMIGGSGTSIIEPLLYYFSELLKEAKYKIIPIIIDRNFNSEIVSRNIRRIKEYQNVCAYSASESIILNPYLFIDNNSLFDGNNNLDFIVEGITNSDIVAFSYSIYNKDNIRIKQTLVDNIRRTTEVRIFDLIFTKYFNLDFDGEEQVFKHEELIENLEMNQDLISHEYCFIAGTPTPSKYIKSTHQRNPFNIVSLILSYGLASSITKTIDEDKGYYEYCIPETYNGQYSLGELIREKNFRIIIIKNDFKAICLNIISNHRIENLKNITETEIFKLITAYYDNSSKLLYQLCDKTIHPLSLINFRKNIDFDQIWKYLSRQKFKIIKLKNTKESFVNELLSHANRDSMINTNMTIHEILSSIDCFINQHIEEIETLYH